MIELYRPANCPSCAEIEETLRELVIAHQVIEVEAGQAETLPVGTSLPAFREGNRVVSGAEAIALYLRELERSVADWRRFQGDSCYLDDSGAVC
ncbi:MAG TPA: glutathione S-transferase N-terminal domain-containing protein [Anaerolineae bacterium]|nr:glutathione S-transferase N-terminal domain-containing protein [Anaerolineae bacterium]HMR64140.1 glutathione S-transferase N-terminal domain-containing protein [Anaerolineae bacterium]